MTLIVHGGTPSPFARKVRVAILEKGLDFENQDLVPFPKTPELLAMHPLGKIPVLEHDGTIVPDSSVICAYLERIHPEPRLYPEDPKDFARALFLEEYADTRLAETIGPVLFERFIKPNFFKQETDTERVREALENEIPPAFDWLEKQLGDGETLVGPRLSIADVAVGAQLQSLVFAQEAIDDSRWPKLARYASKLHARPSFEKAAS